MCSSEKIMEGSVYNKTGGMKYVTNSISRQGPDAA